MTRAWRLAAGVPRNLIIQFDNDAIDESPRLHSVLQANSTVARELRYTVRIDRQLCSVVQS